MTSGPHASSSSSVPGLHVATITHEGRIWDAYLEFDDDPRRPTSYRGRLRFDPADEADGKAARTTVIIIEDSYEEAVAKARSLDSRQLQGLLRSSLPDDSSEGDPSSAEGSAEGEVSGEGDTEGAASE